MGKPFIFNLSINLETRLNHGRLYRKSTCSCQLINDSVRAVNNNCRDLRKKPFHVVFYSSDTKKLAFSNYDLLMKSSSTLP